MCQNNHFKMTATCCGVMRTLGFFAIIYKPGLPVQKLSSFNNVIRCLLYEYYKSKVVALDVKFIFKLRADIKRITILK